MKGNTPYPNLLIEEILSPIDNMDMTRYLMYKNKTMTWKTRGSLRFLQNTRKTTCISSVVGINM
jgi:hypothetical protein